MSKELIEAINKLPYEKTIERLESGRVLAIFEPENKKQAVCCDTQEQWDFLCNQIGVSYTYQGDDESLAIRINKYEHSWSDVETYKNNGFQILSFNEYLDKAGFLVEWKDFLICEAKRRGFKEGVVFNGVEGEDKDKNIKIGAIKIPTNIKEHTFVGLFCGNSWIYYKGNWGTVVKPIFTTEDGVDVYEGDECYAVERNYLFFLNRGEKADYSGQSSAWLYFSAKEVAEKWINKPLEMIEGEIYYKKETPKHYAIIFRYKHKKSSYSSYIVTNDSGSGISQKIQIAGSINNESKVFLATKEQKKQLIKAEVDNGFYWELEKDK